VPKLKLISETEAAKYPFFDKARTLIDSLKLTLDDLSKPGYERVLERGAERVLEAITKGEVSAKLGNTMTELLSFPIAIMYIKVIKEKFLDRRYALGEALRAYKLLRGENNEKLSNIAKLEFNWDLKKQDIIVDGKHYDFALYFTDYLKLTSRFHEEKWKLINRIIEEGYVLISRMESARLLQVEVEKHIKKNVSNHSTIKLPSPIQDIVDKIDEVLSEKLEKLGEKSLPSEVINEAFPPCMQYCMKGLLSGRNASHMERFALTSFLVNTGMDLDKLVDLYISVTDFDEGLTRYQIEHIAGLRGSRTKYKPPNCSTLKTHGVCKEGNGTCKNIRHPINFYKLKSSKILQDRNQSKKIKE
jgi:DNA primase large subunit